MVNGRSDVTSASKDSNRDFPTVASGRSGVTTASKDSKSIVVILNFMHQKNFSDVHYGFYSTHLQR